MTKKLYYLNSLNTNKNSFLNKPINQKILDQIIKQFLTDLENLKNNFNNIIFKKYKKTLFLLKYTFIDLIKDLKTNYDIIQLFNFSINSKVKDLIISYNYNPYVFCINALNGSCNLKDKCYSNKQELAYKIIDNKLYAYSLINTLSNFIFLYYTMNAKNTNTFLYYAFKFNKKDLKDKTIIRFNNKADLKDQTILNYFNNMFILLKRSYNIKYAYTYTKTKNLNYKNIDPNFIINKSYGLIDIKDLEYIIKNNKFNAYITINKDQFKANKKYLLKLKKANKINICNASLKSNLNNACTNCLNACYKDHNKNTINSLH